MRLSSLLKTYSFLLMAVLLVAGCSTPSENMPVSATSAPGASLDQIPETTGSVPTVNPNGSTTITLADEGQTITMHSGDQFLLDLGSDYNWTVTPADPSILSRVVNITVIRGAQGVYEAHQAGSTELIATGDPACRSAQPPCAMPSRAFKIHVIVQ